MKVTNVDLYCACSHLILNLSYRDPSGTNPYNVKAIYGLDADEIVSSYYATGKVSDKPFYDMYVKQRELVVRVVLNPNYTSGQTVSDLRDDMYRAIATNRNGRVALRFKDGNQEQASIEGHISKLEAAHFSEIPEIQITITCDYTVFKAPNPVTYYQEDISVMEGVIVDNISTAPHGCEMEFEFLEETNSFELRDATNPDWSFAVTAPVIFTDETFLTGDRLYISSINKKRNVTMRRNLVTLQMADKIVPYSVWPIVFPGENKFLLKDPGFYRFESFSHTHSFWGV